MTKEISHYETRKKLNGDDILDVIYNDGTKKRIDPVKIKKRRDKYKAKGRTAEANILNNEIAIFNKNK